MQFIIHAYDGTDADAMDRRMAARPKHLAYAAQIKGRVICGGGILDDEGRMIGSAMVFEFPSKEDFDEYLKNEPYIVEGVWKDIRINRYNTVILNNEKIGA